VSTGDALRIAIVAGETSGDLLGSRVLRALRRALPGRPINAEGIGGAAMEAEGFRTLFPLERLAVMGLVEPLGRLPELLRIRGQLRRRWQAARPQLFLGIDAPDFNLALAHRLRTDGLHTAQLVSPTVWAWRPKRVHTVAAAVDDLFCLFPFEAACYDDVELRTHFVGHPLVRELRAVPSRQAARARLGLAQDAPVIALLPGSRAAEVAQLGETLVAAGRLLRSRDHRRQLIMPAASAERHAQCEQLLANAGAGGEILLTQGGAREAMIAADVVLLASGTATLEAMLLRRPMVIAYRVAPVSFQLMSRLAVTRFVGLPNVLAGREVVPELLQESLSAPALALEAEALLAHGEVQLSALDDCRAALDTDFDAEIGARLAQILKQETDNAAG
jgi:lipid-A-disaccharide synthase